METRRPVLVLGASGFIGSRIVAALSAHPVWRPVAAGRRATPDGSRIAVDATDPAALANAVRAADTVINCVAGNEATMTGAAKALCDAKPARIVHFSSMAVYGAAAGQVTEATAPVTPLSGYGQAKLESEATVLRYREAGGQAVILRPTCVFGPGSPQWTTRLATLLRARRLGDLGSAGDGWCNLAYVDDVAAAAVAALDSPSGVFNVNSSADLTWNAFFLRFARALDATPVRRIPRRELRLETKLLAPARRIGAKILRSPLTEAITPSLAALFAQEIRIDHTAMTRDLGVSPTPLDVMIDASVDWLRGSPASARTSPKHSETLAEVART